jgi:DNA-binding response OmpR family regulator
VQGTSDYNCLAEKEGIRDLGALLIVEDEHHIAEGLRYNLEAEGYDVIIASDGETALALLHSGKERIDAIVLDCMLPGIDGFAVAHELRESEIFIPILMLTARGRPEDVLRGFEAGADDYLPKPFELAILLARLKGLLRRRAWLARDTSQPAARIAIAEDKREFSFNGRSIDFESLELRAKGEVVRLTAMEGQLLRYLTQNAGKAISRQAMLADVWGLKEDTDTRAIDNFIVRLRRYIEDDPAKPEHLLTVRGVGYRFVGETKG